MTASVVVCLLLAVVVVVKAGVPKQYEPKSKYEPVEYHDSYTYKPAYAPYLNVTRECGVVPEVNRYFLHNADDLAFGEYPWHVAIIDGRTRKFLCSGTLVSDYHVVTTASCVEYVRRSDIVVRLGEWDIRTNKNPEEAYRDLELGVSAKLAHPQHVDSLPYGSFDVALLTLSKIVDFDRYPQIIPICLPDYVSDDYGTCYVAGWGESELETLRVDLAEPIAVDFDTVSYDLKYETPKYKKLAYSPVEYKEHAYETAKYSQKYKRSLPPYSPEYKPEYKPSYPHEYKPYYTYVPEIEEVPKSGHESDHTSAPVFDQDLSQTLDFAKVKKVDHYDSYGKEENDQFLVKGVDGYRSCKADVGSSYACIAPEHSQKYKRSADYTKYDYPAKKTFKTGPTSDEYTSRTRLVLSGIVTESKPCSRSSGLAGIVSTPGIGDEKPYKHDAPAKEVKKEGDDESATVLSIEPVLAWLIKNIISYAY